MKQTAVACTYCGEKYTIVDDACYDCAKQCNVCGSGPYSPRQLDEHLCRFNYIDNRSVDGMLHD